MLILVPVFVSFLMSVKENRGGPGSSVVIANGHELDGPGIGGGGNPGRGEIYRTRPDRPWGPHSLLYNGYRDFPEGKAAGAWC
jgi:hypothetical protein